MIPVHIPCPSVLASLILLVCLGSCRDKHEEKGNTSQGSFPAKQASPTGDPDAPDKAPITTRSSSKPNSAAKESFEEIRAKDKELIFSVRLSVEASQDREHLWKAMEYPEHGTLSVEQCLEADRVLANYENSDDTTRLLFGWLAMERLFPGRGFAMLGDGGGFAKVNRKAVGMICRTLGTEPNPDSEGMHLTGMKNLCRAYLRAHAEDKAIGPP